MIWTVSLTFDLSEHYAGPIKKIDLNCDEHGKSKGVATVEYKNSEDASKAAKLYNQRTLDGRAMRIEVILNPGAVQALAAAPTYIHSTLIRFDGILYI